jgi:type IV secretion system protein VirB5
MPAEKHHPAAARNPYLDARREWNERYGSYIARARQWRLLAVLCGGIALVAVAGIAWIGSQSKLVPFLVEVNRNGDAVSGRVATATRPTDDTLIRAVLGAFIENWRTVSVDAGIQQRVIDRTYAHLSSTDPAFNAVNAFYQANNPFERGARETVAVEIRSVLRTSASSLQVEWQEETRDRKGLVTGVARFKAAAVVALSRPTKEEDIMQNPVGLYVKELTWSRELTGS